MAPSASSRKKRGAAEASGKESPAKKRLKPSIEIPTALTIARNSGTPSLKAPPPNSAAQSQASKKAKTTKAVASARNPKKISQPVVASSLNASEARLWAQSHAAKCACEFHNPGGKARLVGIVTRTVTVDASIDPFPSMEWSTRGLPFRTPRKMPPSFRHPTVAQAKEMILREGREMPEGRLLLEANELVQEWKKTIRTPYTPGWDDRGELLHCPLDGALKVSRILTLLRDGILTDDEPDMTRDFFHGLRKIPTDVKSVLTSLSRFGRPEEPFYGQPAVASFVMAELQSIHAHRKTYQLKIPVYVHRLAFEIMSLYDCHTIWCALDEQSYNVLRPLSIPPMAEERVFFSAETPRVVLDDDEEASSSEDDDGDVLLERSTRRSDVISAYTFPGFFKLMESKGCDISSWPDIEAKLKGQLQVELMPHQIHGVCWMIQQEQIEGGLNALLWEERQFADGQGSYFFSPAVGQIRLTLGGLKKHTKIMSPPPVGGILCDEMGLGKTIQVLALVLATRDRNDDDDPPTLIVVPPALLTQWKAETKKITGNHMNTRVFDSESASFVPAFEDQSTDGKVDLVLTTYAALSKDVAARVLKSHSWKRIVLDEMQEIRSSTTVLAKNCKGLTGQKRWMVSGTPLFDSIEDFKGELDFLKIEPFSADTEDGFFDFCVTQHWEAKSHYGLEALRALSLVMLRRSKTMTYLDPISKTQLPLLGLPPLTVTMEPVPQLPSERATYCFLEYLVHSNLRDADHNEKEQSLKGRSRDEGKRRLFLKLLRESCVSANLLTGGPGCPSRLDTLDRVMVEQHRKNPSVGETAGTGGPSADVLSVDKAIEFLSRVIDTARVEDGFETTHLVGGGLGRSRRLRAVESTDSKLEEAKRLLKEAEGVTSKAKSKRAKARWHLALEKITTGALQSEGEAHGPVNRSIRNLWQWRRLIIESLQTARVSETDVPVWLCRGWRPSTNFFRTESFYRARANWRRLLLRVVQGEIFRSKFSLPIEDRLSTTEHENAHDFNADNELSDDSTTKQPVMVPTTGVSLNTRKYHALWRWRFLWKHKMRGTCDSLDYVIPEVDLDDKGLLSLSLLRLSKRYRWAHPLAILLEEIPSAVSVENVRQSIAKLDSSEGQPPQSLSVSLVCRNSTSWKAYVQFSNANDLKRFLAQVKKKEGVKLTHQPLAWLEEQEQKASEAVKDAAAANRVYPCDENITKLRQAKAAYALSRRGLRMHSVSNQRERHVVVRAAFDHMRSDASSPSRDVMERCTEAVDDCLVKLGLQNPVISAQKRMIERLEKVTCNQVSSEVQNLSTFEVFEALKSGNSEVTSCPVCLCPLGSDCDGLVSLTRCGHLFCKGCLEGYFASRTTSNTSCISCRKPIRRSESVVVDPSIDDDEAAEEKRDEARYLVREASDMLEQSNGHLEPYLWEALYLSFDPPKEVSRSRHGTFTAIPGQLLAHLRHTTGLPLNGREKWKGIVTTSTLSSRIRRLTEDLPRQERSVVFANSNGSVKHVVAVLEGFAFDVNSLYTGQKEADSREALDEWRSSTAGVLVVQSGAAACGLTLTDCSKLFILEPFLRFEEEQQAYCRLHRYGQTKNVECKVYYAPVSVESRLLEWRKKKSSESPDEKVIFAKLKSEVVADGEEDDVTQSRYLLGLDQPTGTEDMDE